jgi:hypothetical protein
MAEGISRLIENPTLRQQFSKASIAKVQADHHQRHALPILQKLFQQLVLHPRALSIAKVAKPTANRMAAA